jgi:nucleotide-binding universal stress UspA family protein
MNTQADTPALSLESIFHPSDFSQASEVAFAHALKLALVASTELHIMHVAPEATPVHWADFPGVRAMLVRWGLLPEGSAQEEVARLGPRVHKILASHVDPVDSILHYLRGHPTDLVVLATHQREGLDRWLHQAVAAPLARQAGTMTLFVPHGTEGFVSLADGAMSLQRLLLPVDTVPPPQAAITVAAGLARLLGCDRVTFTLVHVGPAGDMPAVQTPEHPGWSWERVVRQGPSVEQILDVGTTTSADLIVLTTQGRHGFLDALRGSTSERIVRGAPCPVLAIPAT